MTSGVWRYFEIIQINDPTERIVNKAQCTFFKELYSCKSIGGTGHLNKHVKSCTPKHTGGDANPRARGGGIQIQVSQSSSTGSLGVFNYNLINARY